MWPWTTKPVISGYICSNSQQYIAWIKIIDFSFMPKIIRILSKDHVPWRYFVNFTVNISKIYFCKWICIAKDFILTTLKVIFLIFWFFCTLRFQIIKYCPILTNHNGKLIYSVFRWCINLNFKKLTLMTGFVVQGHILVKHICSNSQVVAVDFGMGIICICIWVCLLSSFGVRI